MATLKEHQAAMVDLLANGSGIPASASRLAHAMHDLINVLYVAFPNMPQTKDEDWINGRETQLQALIAAKANPTPALKELMNRRNATTPGLNDKAISKREKALKTDSPAKWPTPAEQRVKELENTIRQLKANNAKLRKELSDLKYTGREEIRYLDPEQAGCRKEDTQLMQACLHNGAATYYGEILRCDNCGGEIPE